MTSRRLMFRYWRLSQASHGAVLHCSTFCAGEETARVGCWLHVFPARCALVGPSTGLVTARPDSFWRKRPLCIVLVAVS